MYNNISFRPSYEEIDTYLKQYTDYESLHKEYFEKNHCFFPLSELPEEFKGPYKIIPTDLRLLSPFSTSKATSSYMLSPQNTFLEYQFFAPDYDIYIHKQPRFTNSALQDHQYYEICYQYSGNSQFTLSANNEEILLILEQGDFLFIPESMKHAVFIDSDSILLNIGIRTSTFSTTFLPNIPKESILGHFFSNVIAPNEPITSYVHFKTHADAFIHQHLLELIRLYCMHTIYTQNLMNLQLTTLFLHLMERYSYTIPISNTCNKLMNDFPKLLHYIENHYMSETAQNIAKHFGYSFDHLNHLYKSITGETLGNTLLNLKLQKAEALLKNTTLPVQVISEYLGYQNVPSMIRIFKKRYGMTPLQYRKYVHSQN